MGTGLGQALMQQGQGGGQPGQGNAALTPVMAMIQAMSGGGGMPKAPGGSMPGMPGGPAPLVPQAQQPMSFKYSPNYGTPPKQPVLQPNPQAAADAEAEKQRLLEQQRQDAMNRQGAQTPYQDYNNVGA